MRSLGRWSPVPTMTIINMWPLLLWGTLKLRKYTKLGYFITLSWNLGRGKDASMTFYSWSGILGYVSISTHHDLHEYVTIAFMGRPQLFKMELTLYLTSRSNLGWGKAASRNFYCLYAILGYVTTSSHHDLHQYVTITFMGDFKVEKKHKTRLFYNFELKSRAGQRCFYDF